MASGSYSEYTLAQFRAELSSRLYDNAVQFWPTAELNLQIAEALRMWNALTAYWRGDFTFSTQAATTWYDISNLTVAANTLRPTTLTDASIYALMQYNLLEPQGMNPWVGSLQYSAQDLLSAVQRRRDELLSISGCTVLRLTTPAVAGRILLPESTLDVRRMAYLPSTSFPTQLPSPMFAEDAWAEQSFSPSYLQLPAGTPIAFMLSTQPPLSFDVDRTPAFGGNYELLLTEAGAPLSVATPSPLGFPDDFAWVLRFGALADLFSRDSDAQDPLRAAYCEQMYRMGLAVLTTAPALLQLRVNNVPVITDAVTNADAFQPGWQTLTPGVPTTAYTAGLNLVALAPQPTSSGTSITATVVRNAPIPANDAAFIQAGWDDANVILDLCVHLALLKSGGAEFQSTIPLLQRFLKQAATYRSKLLEIAEYSALLLNVSQQQENALPRMQPDTLPQVEVANV
jgi:hypothetical protein